MSERERDEAIRHRALTRLNATEHEHERAVELAEIAMDARTAEKWRDEDHMRLLRRLMAEWDTDQDARAMDVARGTVEEER